MGTLLAIRNLGSIWKCICPKPEGTHCLRFEIWGDHFAKNGRGTLLAISDLGSSFCKKLNGDTACDSRFGKYMEVYLSKNLRGTLLAI